MSKTIQAECLNYWIILSNGNQIRQTPILYDTSTSFPTQTLPRTVNILGNTAKVSSRFINFAVGDRPRYSSAAVVFIQLHWLGYAYVLTHAYGGINSRSDHVS